MQKLFSTLNTIPEMSSGLYTRFSVTLYTLVKQYYPKLDVSLVKTKDNIAVLSLNGLVLNPYIGIKLDPNFVEDQNSVQLDFFLEKKVPETQEAIDYIEALSHVLALASKNIPLTIENVARHQSKIHNSSFAVDVYWNGQTVKDDQDGLESCNDKNIIYPRKGELVEIWSSRRKKAQKLKAFNPESLKPAVLRDSGFRFPNINGIVTDVDITWINPDLDIEVIKPSDKKRSDTPPVSVENVMINDKHNFRGDGTEDLTSHFVLEPESGSNPGSNPGFNPGSKFFKPFACLDAIGAYEANGDFVAGGLFMASNRYDPIAYKAYTKGEKALVLNPKIPLFTMVLTIDVLTVHKMTDTEEANIDMPL